ncbi:hypothetical protein U1Q18_022855, partial [Sarracenia purpurea var. burkii]
MSMTWIWIFAFRGRRLASSGQGGTVEDIISRPSRKRPDAHLCSAGSKKDQWVNFDSTFVDFVKSLSLMIFNYLVQSVSYSHVVAYVPVSLGLGDVFVAKASEKATVEEALFREIMGISIIADLPYIVTDSLLVPGRGLLQISDLAYYLFFASEFLEVWIAQYLREKGLMMRVSLTDVEEADEADCYSFNESSSEGYNPFISGGDGDVGHRDLQ